LRVDFVLRFYTTSADSGHLGMSAVPRADTCQRYGAVLVEEILKGGKEAFVTPISARARSR